MSHFITSSKSVIIFGTPNGRREHSCCNATQLRFAGGLHQRHLRSSLIASAGADFRAQVGDSAAHANHRAPSAWTGRGPRIPTESSSAPCGCRTRCKPARTLWQPMHRAGSMKNSFWFGNEHGDHPGDVELMASCFHVGSLDARRAPVIAAAQARRHWLAGRIAGEFAPRIPCIPGFLKSDPGPRSSVD